MSVISPSPPALNGAAPPAADGAAPPADYGTYCRPGLAPLLEAVGLDVAYVAGEGDRLWREVDGRTVEVLDFVGGYGTTLFGHNHPELVEEARRLLGMRLPIMVQGSYRTGAAELARRLCERLGDDYVVTFTNSGTEAVEAALKHARLQTGRSEYWAVKGAFHGKTLGAVQLSPSYGPAFQGLGPAVRHLDPWDPASWQAEEAHAPGMAAAFLEPVLGEGGVKPLPADFLAWLQGVCRQHKVPIVADEIQTGMGRCGAVLASHRLGLDPDYVCLAKALGGGIAKIGALLVKRSHYVPHFSVIQTSTFAEDEYTSRLALRALEISERDRLPERAAATGAWLRERLEALRADHPDVLKEVRGLGLMIGLEFQDLSDSPSNMLRLLSQHRYLVPFAASYLLNVHRVRLLHTLSQPFTLRIQPSAYVSREDCGRLLAALEQLAQALRARDVAHLTAHQVGLAPAPVVPVEVRRPTRDAPAGTRRVAFIGHILLPEHVAQWDPGLGRLPVDDAAQLLTRTSRFVGPTVFNQFNVRSATGKDVHLTFIGLNLSAAQILEHRRSGEFRWIMDQIEEAVTMARDLGCNAVGLGGYTSIVSANCMRVRTTGIGLTSGNALTVGMAVRGMQAVAAERGIELRTASLGVVGAGGNTASTLAMLLAPEVAELVLIVRRTDSIRVERLMAEVQAEVPGVRVRLSDDMHELRRCQLIACASNAPEPLIYPGHLGRGPIAICDISAPSDVDRSVLRERPDVAVFDGGIVQLPRNPDFHIAGLPLKQGHVFACMAETILMGLEETDGHGSYGRIEPDQVRQTLQWADRHGFTLAVDHRS